MTSDSEEAVETLRRLVHIRYAQQDWRTWRRYTSDLTQALRALSPEQARSLATELWSQYLPEKISSFLGQLNMSIPGALSALASEFVAHRQFLPSWLYLGASPVVSRELLGLLDDPAFQNEQDNLLLALAWIGDDLVQTQLRTWRKSPPPWRANLHLPPEEYAFEAGWELMPDGKSRQLYHHACYELTPVNEPEGVPSAVAVAIPHEASCRWCGRQLLTLLDMDLREPRLAFIADQQELRKGRDGPARLRIAYCQWCSTYATLHTDVDLHGGSVWSDTNEETPHILTLVGRGEDIDFPTTAQHRLALGSARRSPFEVVGRFRLNETGVSQVGGYPEWIQDAAYSICPSCQQRMRYIGQVAWEDMYELAEGCIYAFLCLPCGKAATTFQQT